MQHIYNLLNSRWKLPMIVVCVVFNISILLYIVRPASNVVFGPEEPGTHILDQYKYQHVEKTNILAGTKATKSAQKNTVIVRGPVTFVRHFASKVNSSRFAHPQPKETASTTTEKNTRNFTKKLPQKDMVLNKSNDDNNRPLVEHLLANRMSFEKRSDLDFRYLINPTKMCQSDTYLLIAVCSAVQRVDYRKAIRETWGTVVRKIHLGVKLVFVVGATSEENSHYQNIIQSESDTYEDMLQIDQVDHSRNLSFKTLGLLQWIQDTCENSTFVMKTDDDIFINTRDLLKEVKDLSIRSKVIMGHVIKGAQPITDRNDPWYNPPELYKDKTYPDYLSGSAYLFSSSIIPLLLESSKQNPVFWLEDIYITGILPKTAQISLLNNPNFVFIKPEIMFDFCKYSKIQVFHGISSDAIRKLWKSVNNLNC